LRVDPRDPQMIDGVREHVGEVRGRVGRGQVDVVTALGQGDGQRRRDGGLTDPALTHAQDQAVALLFHVVQKVTQGHCRNISSG
jgi:hypothetical protein